MTVRDDLTIEYFAEPRIAEIAAPATEIVMQDIVHTLRKHEDSFTGMSWQKLINASGKEDLGGGVKVGITVALQNLKLAFEARTTAAHVGNVTSILDPPYNNSLRFEDDTAAFITNNVARGSLVINYTDQSIADVITVQSETILVTKTLVNGTLNTYTIGDDIQVFNIIQCSATGGNLVAVDENLDTFPAILPTAFTQVILTSSASATLSESSSIQYASFGGGVTVNISNGVSGIAFPTGTIEQPVNNIADAITIANSRGLNKFYIQGNLTLTENATGFTFIGESMVRTSIVIDDIAVCANVIFDQCHVTGILDGNTRFQNCKVGNVTYVNGTMFNCGLYGNIQLAGNTNALLADCNAVEPNDLPIIDMGGSGQNCILTDYSGQITFRNLTDSSNKISVQIDGGKIILDSSITAGIIGLNGIGALVNNATSYTSLTQDGLLNKDTVSKAVWDESIGNHLLPDTMGHQMYHQAYGGIVHVDVLNGSSGTTFPTGTTHDPCDNLTDALSIANEHYIKIIHVIGDLTIDGEDITGFTIAADRSLGNSVTIISMVNSDSCYFQDITVNGALTGATRFTNCVLGTLTGFDGGAKNCLLTGEISITGSGANYFTECDQYIITADDPVILNVYDKMLNIIRGRGNFGVFNKTGSNLITFGLTSGRVTIDSTCIAGYIGVAGIVDITDNSGPGCTVINYGVSNSSITDAVWDENLNAHIVDGSAADILSDNASSLSNIDGKIDIIDTTVDDILVNALKLIAAEEHKAIVHDNGDNTQTITIYEANGVDIYKQYTVSVVGADEIRTPI